MWSKYEPNFPKGSVQLLIYSMATKKYGVATLTTYENFHEFRGFGGPRTRLPEDWRWMVLPESPTE